LLVGNVRKAFFKKNSVLRYEIQIFKYKMMILGIRQEQDIYVRLIDSVSKQVSQDLFYNYSLFFTNL